MLNLFISSVKEKGDIQCTGDKVTTCPYTHRCETTKALKTLPIVSFSYAMFITSANLFIIPHFLKKLVGRMKR